MKESAPLTEEDWKILYKKSFDHVKQYVLSNNGNEQQAEDLYHEAFIAAWRNVQLGRYETRGERSFGSYLLAIAKNKWIDVLRSSHNKRTLQLKDEIDAGMPENRDTAEEDAGIEMIKAQFNNLGENCKNLLIAFYYKKKTMREISVEREWTEATTRNNKYRCLQKLRALINQNIP